MFARARLALPCDAPHDVGDVCLVCRERVLGDAVEPCGHRLHSAYLAEGLRVQVEYQQGLRQTSVAILYVSVLDADDAAPDDQMVKEAEAAAVEGEAVDFPEVDADRKHEATLRYVVAEEVLVLAGEHF